MNSIDSVQFAQLGISIVGLLAGIVGACVAYKKWRWSQKRNRAEYLQMLLKEFNGDELISKISSEDSASVKWEDRDHEGARQITPTIEKSLNLISYLCYLRTNNLIDYSEFIMFKYKIDIVLNNPRIATFLEDESRRLDNDDKGPYYYIFMYLGKRGAAKENNVEGALSAPILSTDERMPIDEKEFIEPTMIIKINRAYREDMNDNDILNATRKWWRINPETGNRMKLIFAVANGVVKGVYRIKGKWQKDTSGMHDGRYCFDGESADMKLVTKFKGRSVVNLFPKGASNPIRYFFPEEM